MASRTALRIRRERVRGSDLYYLSVDLTTKGPLSASKLLRVLKQYRGYQPGYDNVPQAVQYDIKGVLIGR